MFYDLIKLGRNEIHTRVESYTDIIDVVGEDTGEYLIVVSNKPLENEISDIWWGNYQDQLDIIESLELLVIDKSIGLILVDYMYGLEGDTINIIDLF